MRHDTSVRGCGTRRLDFQFHLRGRHQIEGRQPFVDLVTYLFRRVLVDPRMKLDLHSGGAPAESDLCPAHTVYILGRAGQGTTDTATSGERGGPGQGWLYGEPLEPATSQPQHKQQDSDDAKDHAEYRRSRAGPGVACHSVRRRPPVDDGIPIVEGRVDHLDDRDDPGRRDGCGKQCRDDPVCHAHDGDLPSTTEPGCPGRCRTRKRTRQCRCGSPVDQPGRPPVDSPGCVLPRIPQ